MGDMTLTDCTVSGNSAVASGLVGGQGGGLWNVGMMSLTNCTVSGNSATNNGGGLYNGGLYGSTVMLTNCTVSGNSAANGGGFFNAGSFGLLLELALKVSNSFRCIGQATSQFVGIVF